MLRTHLKLGKSQKQTETSIRVIYAFEGEGYGTPTDLRYCINSISMTLEPRAIDPSVTS